MRTTYYGEVLATAMWVLQHPGKELKVMAPTEAEAQRFARDVAAEVLRLRKELGMDETEGRT